jgi:hypothetical protein
MAPPLVVVLRQVHHSPTAGVQLQPPPACCRLPAGALGRLGGEPGMCPAGPGPLLRSAQGGGGKRSAPAQAPPRSNGCAYKDGVGGEGSDGEKGFMMEGVHRAWD